MWWLPDARPWEALLERVAEASQDTPVRMITARVPAHVLRPQLEAAGADMHRVSFLDIVSDALSAHGPETKGIVYAPFMENLELVATRARRLAPVSGGADMVVFLDDLESLCRRHAVPYLQQMHIVVTEQLLKARQRYVLVARPGADIPAPLLEFLRQRGIHEVGADGAVEPVNA